MPWKLVCADLLVPNPVVSANLVPRCGNNAFPTWVPDYPTVMPSLDLALLEKIVGGILLLWVVGMGVGLVINVLRKIR